MAKGPYRHIEDFKKPKKIEEGGVVKISGNFLTDHEQEIIGLVKHEAGLAEQKNAKHRITKIEKTDGIIVVEVSEHNLAIHIGKALHHAYKGKNDFKFLKGEKFVEVDWRRD